MAKKTATKTTAAKSSKKASAKKAPAKKPAKKKVERVEIQLEPAEVDACELVKSSEKVCQDLEVAVTSAISEAVRKVFKQHKIVLTASQAQQVALLLFGD